MSSPTTYWNKISVASVALNMPNVKKKKRQKKNFYYFISR